MDVLRHLIRTSSSLTVDRKTLNFCFYFSDCKNFSNIVDLIRESCPSLLFNYTIDMCNNMTLYVPLFSLLEAVYFDCHVSCTFRKLTNLLIYEKQSIVDEFPAEPLSSRR